MNIGFVGLGVMGFPMAGYLSANSGQNVFVYNRTYSKVENWLGQYKGTGCQTPQEIAQQCDVIFMCLGRDEDVLSVVEGENGLLSGLKENSIVVDHTTTSYNLAIKLNDLFAKNNIEFMDAPISGGQAGAENGTLTTMMGGQQSTLDKINQLLQCYCKNITLIGEVGSGQLAKMVNQICIAGTLQGLSEGLKFAQSANLNIDLLINAIGGGAAQSWQMDNRAKTMAEDKFDFGFAIDWMIKDLEYGIAQANQNGVDVKMTKQVLDSYKQLANAGHNRHDTSVLIKSVK